MALGMFRLMSPLKGEISPLFFNLKSTSMKGTLLSSSVFSSLEQRRGLRVSSVCLRKKKEVEDDDFGIEEDREGEDSSFWINRKRQPAKQMIQFPEGVEKVSICRCWESSTFPFCDGAHKRFNKEFGTELGPLVISRP
eukprot:CAMPEP_0201475442 /NCGR_PEP_ID=MMETSP0151_2-20130828/870_1 /ASSEMBLY_ACC=CAM_ASM_000257 /TAXON_ID=200890 /ORGANISM="Paramoeba atlantica, Strain 621/1 / CCAP 1560/9" /LENGTH=137 /DNA_ID=CAMNT_0047855535 /DNA_START=53 /DNA_END=466 /DNA_ORIENTATION=-